MLWISSFLSDNLVFSSCPNCRFVNFTSLRKFAASFFYRDLSLCLLSYTCSSTRFLVSFISQFSAFSIFNFIPRLSDRIHKKRIVFLRMLLIQLFFHQLCPHYCSSYYMYAVLVKFPSFLTLLNYRKLSDISALFALHNSSCQLFVSSIFCFTTFLLFKIWLILPASKCTYVL